MTTVKKGDEVTWKWGKGEGHGVVKAVSPKETELQTGGKTVKRKGTKDDPAVTVDSDKGNDVLKLAHELEKD